MTSRVQAEGDWIVEFFHVWDFVRQKYWKERATGERGLLAKVF